MPGKARDGKELLPALSKAARKYTRRKNLPAIAGDPWIRKLLYPALWLRRLTSISYLDMAPSPSDFWLDLVSRRHQGRLENMRREVGVSIPRAPSCWVVGWQNAGLWEATFPIR